MYSTYEQLAKEQFYPVSRLESEVSSHPPAQTGERQQGIISGIADALKHSSVVRSDGKLDVGRLILLILTVLLFLEDSENESDLLIIAAAMFLTGM